MKLRQIIMQEQRNNQFMKKIIFIIAAMFLGSCFYGDPLGYRNIEIKNLSSPNIIIEGMEYRRVSGKGEFFPAKYDDASLSIGISHHGIITPDAARTKEPKYREFDRLKIYYKSKKCLLFYLDEGNKDVFSKYRNSYKKDRILVLTKNGLEFMTPDQYESAKGKYTINDSNVNCLKQ